MERKLNGAGAAQALAFGLVLALVHGACSGANRLVDGHLAYNEAVRRAADQELLLNIVRLRYLDSLEFLAFSAINSQLRFSVGLNASGGEEAGNSLFSAGGTVGYSSTPTFSFTPQRGGEFARRLTEPLDIETLAFLISANREAHEIFRLSVSWMNGLDNYEGKVDPEFIRVTQALTLLQFEGKAVVGVHTQAKPVSPPVPSENVSTRDMLEAVSSGLGIQQQSDGSEIVFTKLEKEPVLYVAEDAANRAELLDMLNLDASLAYYSIRLSSAASVSSEGQHLSLRTRSLLHSMAFLSTGIDVPSEHVAAGVAARSADASVPLDDVFRVWHAKDRPAKAVIAVQHRGYWFYIRDEDATTKRTFFLLAKMFRFALEHDSSTAPVLTLPVGR